MVKNLLLCSFVSLWLTDCIATIMFIGHHGVQSEANPFMRHLLEVGGASLFVAAKLGALLPILSIHKHVPKWVYAWLNVIMLPIVYMGLRMAFWPHG